MLHQMSGLSLKSPLRLFTALVFHLLLLHSCKGQNQLIGSSQPIVATVGDDIILPCHLKPAANVTEDTVEWTRPDLNPRYVHIWYIGLDLVHTQHPSYKGRTSLITEELKHGNISLKLSKVKLSDEGTYKCHIIWINKQSLVELVVGAASSPDIRVAETNTSSSRVVLQCESKGWYPEPEVFWLDGERKLLSAGPTETVRGPDDLYTVISRVTVEKKHSNNFICRVQQNHINQTRETHFIVSDKFFMFQSNSGVSINIRWAVSLAVCILLIFAVVFFVWRQNKRKKTRSCMDKTKRAESNGTKMQVAKAAETKSLMKTQRVSTNNKETKCFNDQQQLQQQRRKEVGNKVENMKIKTQHAELQRLRSELETKKKKELEERQNSYKRFPLLFSTNEQLWKVKEVETLEKKLKTKQDKFDMKMNQLVGSVTDFVLQPLALSWSESGRRLTAVKTQFSVV
ncbi:hypothetical protein PAMA_013618 [Pampus argenteus]